MEKNSNKVLLTVLGIAVLVVATIGATFAYFSATASADAGTVQTGELKVAANATQMTQTNIKPTNFARATADTNADVGHATIKVNTEGTTVTGGYYDIYLTAALSGYTAPNTEAGETASGERADVEYALYNGDTLVATGNLATDLTNEKITATSVTIDPENTGEVEYDLYIYVKETNQEQNDLQKVTASAQLSIQASTKAAQ